MSFLNTKLEKIIFALDVISKAKGKINSKQIGDKLKKLEPCNSRALEVHLKFLVKGGFIKSERGPRGGYIMMKPANLGDVVNYYKKYYQLHSILPHDVMLDLSSFFEGYVFGE